MTPRERKRKERLEFLTAYWTARKQLAKILNVTLDEALLLQIIHREGGMCSQKRLQAETGLHPATLSVRIRSLREKGQATIAAPGAPADRRTQHAALTNKGRKEAERIRREEGKMLKALGGKWGRERVETFCAELQICAGAMRRGGR